METKSTCGDNEECIWLETLINKWADNNSVARIIGMDLKNATSEGDNYVSIIYQAKLSVILCNGMKSKLSVIIKKALENEEAIKALTIPVFKIEIQVYQEILKQFEVLMNEYQDYNEKSWCHLIGWRSYDTIVLEDLKVKNYVVADRKKMLDLNHAKLVLHSLGRFHALGFILIQKGLLKKEDLPPFYCDVGHITVQRSFKGGLMMLSKVIEKYWTPEWKEIGDQLYKEHNVVMGKLKKLFQPQQNNFITLCHGDCWTCNLMFKYSPFEENYPISFKFIDFQTSHVNSYIFDVMHFLYTSVQPEVRRANYELLLSMYHKSLHSTLAFYGFEDRTPTLKNIHSEAERVEYYGFTTSIIALPVTTADVKDAFKLEYLNNDIKWTEAFNEDIFKSNLFKSAVQPELKKWFNNGLFKNKM